MAFVCTKCGACCKMMRILPEILRTRSLRHWKEFENFPYAHDENGVCEKLVNNMCSVYDNRPKCCNIEWVYKQYYCDIPWDVFKKIQILSCRAIFNLIDNVDRGRFVPAEMGGAPPDNVAPQSEDRPSGLTTIDTIRHAMDA